MKARAHTTLLHWKTFQPSSIPKGIKFKAAMKALKAAASNTTSKNGFLLETMKVSAKDPMQITMFVNGPEMAVLPIVSLSATPAIITAPGEMILKKGEMIEINVIKAPHSVKRNSAHNPYRWAVSLWTISWTRNEAVNTNINVITTSGWLPRRPKASSGAIDKPTPETSSALITKSLVSILLKPNFVEGRGGWTVTLNSYGVGPCSLGSFALQISGQLWFSGSRCSAQKSPLQYWHLKGRTSSLPHCWHFKQSFNSPTWN